ncbi:MAG: HAD family hydrolase [Anaerolineaceae bacterium]|nr:HAD family hydrolase [Anaerolineaceae bacterium]
MKFKVLILDHDDTTVNSTPCIHYPAFVKILEELRPGVNTTQEDFLNINLSPGIGSYYVNELGFTPEEMKREKDIWKEYLAAITPSFFPGMPELIRRQREGGGIICVVSHSFPEYIRRDYEAAGVPVPELIFGADLDHSKNKPNPWPIEEIMRQTGCKAEEMLMVDDLKAGLDMAHSCGVRFAACGWGYENPVIRNFMKENADHYLESVADLERLLFSGDPS